MTKDELLGKIAEFHNPIAKDISHLKTELLHLKTAVDSLKSGQDDIRERLDKEIQDHEERITRLELPHKN